MWLWTDAFDCCLLYFSIRFCCLVFCLPKFEYIFFCLGFLGFGFGCGVRLVGGDVLGGFCGDGLNGFIVGVYSLAGFLTSLPFFDGILFLWISPFVDDADSKLLSLLSSSSLLSLFSSDGAALSLPPISCVLGVSGSGTGGQPYFSMSWSTSSSTSIWLKCSWLIGCFFMNSLTSALCLNALVFLWSHFFLSSSCFS